ncbi:hypothetical protein V8F20_001181 [Naviculisporaceae sp. PSN 640]
MRFSTTTVLALPLLAAAAESPFQQYKAKFQNFLGSFGASTPSSDDVLPVASVKANKASAKAKKIETLTLGNWKETLFGPVKPASTQPEEWWVLITGGNKTCFGRCERIEKAFNESAVQFGGLSKSPHLAALDCEQDPVLCNSFSAATGSIYVFDVLPEPAQTEVYWKRFNLTTVTSKDIIDQWNKGSKADFNHVEPDSWFHPFTGKLANYGLAVPLGYFFWIMNVIPSWAMMLLVSFLSRSMMNKQLNTQPQRPGGPAAAAARGAAPGDARS